MSITQSALATRLGMSRRTLLRWLARLEIRPSFYKQSVAYYRPDVAVPIGDARNQALHARSVSIRQAMRRLKATKGGAR